MREIGSKLIKNCKTVGIDVTPVVNSTSVQPLSLRQHFKSVSRAENNHAVRQIWKSEKVDLVLGDEYPVDLRIDLIESILIDRDILVGTAWQ